MDDRDRIAMIDRETGGDTVIRYQLTDHLGSSTIELDDKANIISYEEYHPFGTTSYQKDNTTISQKRYKYNGKERDNETGMYYYGARYYAAWICRFVSVDPLADEYLEWSPYVYCADNPIKYIDPDGRLPFPTYYSYVLKFQSTLKEYLSLKKQNKDISHIEAYLRAYWKVRSETVHYTLDILGMVPVFGEPADAINGGIYLLEGDYVSASFSFAATLPIAGWFATSAKWTRSFIKYTMKYGDEANALVQQTVKQIDESGGVCKEIFTITKSGSYKDAITVVDDVLEDLGDDAIDYVSTAGKKTNPFYGKVVGKKSADGKRYWRIDWDEANGAHINWVNGKQKGSIPFTGGFDRAKSIIENEIMK
jgi:RHS repeat-associated protein